MRMQYTHRDLCDLRSGSCHRLDHGTWRKLVEAGLAVHRPTRRGRRARPYLLTPLASDRGVAEQTPLVSKGLLENNVKYKIRKPTTTGSIHIKLKVLPTNFGLLNCQSTKQKTTILNDWIVDNKLDIAVLTETWLTG